MGIWPSLFNGVLCLCGTAISLYAIHVKREKHQDATYKALCDIDDTYSCSSVLTSQFSDGFGVVAAIFGDDHPLNLSNAYMGLGFYPALLILSLSRYSKLRLLACLASLFSCLLSTYLTYLLVFVLNKVCIVCYSTHLVNFLLFITLASQYRVTTKTSFGYKQD